MRFEKNRCPAYSPPPGDQRVFFGFFLIFFFSTRKKELLGDRGLRPSGGKGWFLGGYDTQEFFFLRPTPVSTTPFLVILIQPLAHVHTSLSLSHGNLARNHSIQVPTADSSTLFNFCFLSLLFFLFRPRCSRAIPTRPAAICKSNPNKRTISQHKARALEWSGMNEFASR